MEAAVGGALFRGHPVRLNRANFPRGNALLAGHCGKVLRVTASAEQPSWRAKAAAAGAGTVTQAVVTEHPASAFSASASLSADPPRTAPVFNGAAPATANGTAPAGSDTVAAGRAVAIYDTTLRDGSQVGDESQVGNGSQVGDELQVGNGSQVGDESQVGNGSQMVGITLSVADKLRIAELLEDLGVDYIEAGWPGSNPKDAEFFQRWKAREAAREGIDRLTAAGGDSNEGERRRAKLAAFGATRYKNTTCEKDANVQALVESGAPVITLVAKAWDAQVLKVLEATLEENLAMIEDTVLKVLEATLEENLAMIEDTVRYFTAMGRHVMLDAEHFYDGFSANPALLRRLLRQPVSLLPSHNLSSRPSVLSPQFPPLSSLPSVPSPKSSSTAPSPNSSLAPFPFPFPFPFHLNDGFSANPPFLIAFSLQPPCSLTNLALSPTLPSHQPCSLTNLALSPTLPSHQPCPLTNLALSPTLPSHQPCPLTNLALSPTLLSHQPCPLTNLALSPTLLTYPPSSEYAMHCVRAAARAGAKEIVLCDTNGGSMPWRVHHVMYPSYDHVMYPSYDPVMYPSYDHVMYPSYDHVMYLSYDHVMYPSYDHVMYPSYDPVMYPSYDPVMYPSYDPVMYPSYDPVIYPSYDHVMYPSYDHVMYPSYDHVMYPSYDPVMYPSYDHVMYPSYDHVMYPSYDHVIYPSYDPEVTRLVVEELARGAAEGVWGRDVGVGVHCHNDCGMAVANSVEAVRAGARVVQGCINGYGERTGNADIVTAIGILQVKLGCDCLPRDSLARLAEISGEIARVAGQPPNPAQPFVGANAFAHKGGIHVAALRKMPEGYSHSNPSLVGNGMCSAMPESYNHCDPSVVGNAMRSVVSDLSGRGNILDKAERAGLDLGREEAGRVLARIKQMEARGFAFENAAASVDMLIVRRGARYQIPFHVLEFSVISTNHLGVPQPVKGSSSSSSSGESSDSSDEEGGVEGVQGERRERRRRERASEREEAALVAESEWMEGASCNSQAIVKVQVGGISQMSAAEGNGPVDALNHALRASLDPHFPQLAQVELVDYRVRLLEPTERRSGTMSTTRVTIDFCDKSSEATWTTVGAHSSIVEASFRALIDGLEFGIVNCNECENHPLGGLSYVVVMPAEQTPQSPAVVRNGLSVLGVIPPPSKTYSVPISPLPPPASPVRSVGIVYPFEPPSTPADWEPHPSIVLVPGGGEGSSRPSAASPSTIDVTLVSHLVDQTRMRIKNRYLNFEPDHHFGSGEKMTLSDFIQRHQKMDKREVKAEGVDSDGNPVEFSYKLHENPIEGQETDGDVTACFELSLKFVRAVDKELEWRMKDLEELEGCKLFRSASYVPDDAKRVENFKKWLAQLHKLYRKKLPGMLVDLMVCTCLF
ncbi:unnamed protein product [Closterium sp. NIES-65]|nr:unnamed protein product [Closterium sp. NIES-65]